MNKKLLGFAACLILAVLVSSASAVVLTSYLMKSNEVTVTIDPLQPQDPQNITCTVYKLPGILKDFEAPATILKMYAVCTDKSFSGVVSFWYRPVYTIHGSEDSTVVYCPAVWIANVTACNGVASYTWTPSPGTYTIYATATYVEKGA